MCASITWTKIATMIFFAMCSTSVQRARAKRADVGPTRGSWSLRFEDILPLSAISLDVQFYVLRNIPWDFNFTWDTNRQPFWFAPILALRYPSYYPSNPYCVRFTLGGRNFVGLDGKQCGGPRVLPQQQRRRSVNGVRIH